jgi:hypothetical protein
VRSLLAQIDLPSLGDEGPEDLEDLLSLFYWLFGAGFLVGVLGHLFDSRLLRATGIAMVMGATVVFLMAVGTDG